MSKLNEKFIGRDVKDVGLAENDEKLKASRLHVLRETSDTEKQKLVASISDKTESYLDCLCLDCGRVKAIQAKNVRGGNKTCGRCKNGKRASVLRRDSEASGHYVSIWDDKSEYEHFVNVNQSYPVPIPLIIQPVLPVLPQVSVFSGYKLMTPRDWKRIRDSAMREGRVIPSTLTPIEVYEIWEKQGRQCAYSGKLLGWGDCDNHVCIDRIDSGGIYEAKNCQAVTGEINQMKYTFSEQFFLQTVEEIHAWQRMKEILKYH